MSTDQLEVWFRNQHVGWLTRVSGASVQASRQRHLPVQSYNTSDGLDAHCLVESVEGEPTEVEYRELHISRKERSLRIVSEDLRHRVSAKVPAYAELRFNNCTRTTIATWAICDLADENEFEWVFDLDQFQPVHDSVPDVDLKRELAIEEAVGVSLTKRLRELEEAAYSGISTSTLPPPLTIGIGGTGAITYKDITEAWAKLGTVP